MTATAVEFRTGVRDKLGYAARWLAVAYRRGARVRVIGEEADLRRLSQLLWVSDKESFVAHAFCDGLGELVPGLERTPIWLGPGRIAGAEPALLLNVGAPVPEGVASYERVVEVVSTEPADTQAGRERWARYRREGLQPAHRQPQDDGEG
jgi:DNA polymerase-3 subunit chi